jgi:hypothetical protein
MTILCGRCHRSGGQHDGSNRELSLAKDETGPIAGRPMRAMFEAADVPSRSGVAIEATRQHGVVHGEV